MARTWESTDPRDVGLEFDVIDLKIDQVMTLHGGLVAIICLIGVTGSLDEAVLLDRVISDRVREDGRSYVETFTGDGQLLDGDGNPDVEHTRNVKTRVAMLEQSGKVQLR